MNESKANKGLMHDSPIRISRRLWGFLNDRQEEARKKELRKPTYAEILDMYIFGIPSTKPITLSHKTGNDPRILSQNETERSYTARLLKVLRSRDKLAIRAVKSNLEVFSRSLVEETINDDGVAGVPEGSATALADKQIEALLGVEAEAGRVAEEITSGAQHPEDVKEASKG